MNIIILLVVFGGFAYRMTAPEDRARYLGLAMGRVRRLKALAAEPGPEYEAFREALRARSRYAFVTPAIVAINVMVVGGMLFGAGAFGDPDTLVAWGANLGTRTTNGEWWRLVTSPFVYTGTLHLLVGVAVLIQLATVLERLAGRLLFAGVYLSAGVFTGLAGISSYPIAVTTGASGAIFGLYGLLLASLTWQLIDELIWLRSQRRREDPDADDGTDAGQRVESGVTIPLIAMTRLGIGGAVFLVYSAVNGLAHTPEFAGLVVGLILGLVLGRRVRLVSPGPRSLGAAMAATAVIVVMCAVPLRHIADVTPEILRVLATEERTAATFETARDALKKQRTTAEALAQLAELTIVPELQAADDRLQALERVPPERQGLVSDAREYLRLRCTSWRARAAAIRSRMDTDPRHAPGAVADAVWRLQAEARFRSSMSASGKAESAERASLVAFSRFKVAAGRR